MLSSAPAACGHGDPPGSFVAVVRCHGPMIIDILEGVDVRILKLVVKNELGSPQIVELGGANLGLHLHDVHQAMRFLELFERLAAVDQHLHVERVAGDDDIFAVPVRARQQLLLLPLKVGFNLRKILGGKLVLQAFNILAEFLERPIANIIGNDWIPAPPEDLKQLQSFASVLLEEIRKRGELLRKFDPVFLV
jgi:hypothetical protein